MKLDELKKLTQIVSNLQGVQLQHRVQDILTEMGMDPGKIYQELEMSSPLVDTHRDTSYLNTQMQLHSHTFYEVIYCVNSCDAEYLVGSERYRLQQGDIVFVPPGVSHRALLPENMKEPYMRYVIWMSVDFMERFARLFPYKFKEESAHIDILRTKGTEWEFLSDMFAAGVEEAERRSDGWEAFVTGNTIQLLVHIKRAADGKTTSPLKAEKPELLDRISAYIEENYSHPIAIGDLAKLFFVSSSTVSHLFKQKLGVSFYRYVTQRRLIAAKTLIEKGNRMDEAALMSGFLDYSSFYRAFKQEYGISPRQYRALQEADIKPHI